MQPTALEAWHRAYPARIEACLVRGPPPAHPLTPWTGRSREQAPTLPIIDAHHHFFPPGPPKVRPPQFSNTFGRVETTGTGFGPADFKRDAEGVNVITTVHVEAGRFYLEQPHIPHYLRPVGETAQIASFSRESVGCLCRGVRLLVSSSSQSAHALKSAPRL